MPARLTLEVATARWRASSSSSRTARPASWAGPKDCEPRLLCKPEEPKAPENRKISRHHCLLDINPPDVCIRDFGSLNGTYVNGQKIGQRQKHEQPGGSFPEHDLKDGDEIRLGNMKFRVSIHIADRLRRVRGRDSRGRAEAGRGPDHGLPLPEVPAERLATGQDPRRPLPHHRRTREALRQVRP